MKSFFKSLALLFILNCIIVLAPQRATAQYDENQGGGNYQQPNEQVFYDQLAPDGQWVNHPNYGYVWIPNAEPEFAPYRTAGHWVLTDYGWTWVSDYRWGWACFHYGRWEFDPYYGWLWLPGHEWAPAWVSWRRCPGYYGWAPMGYHHTVEMVYGDNYYVENDRWVFVDERYVDDPYCSRYYAPRENNYMYVRNGNYIDNRYNDNDRNVVYIAGPRREEVERVTYHPVNRVVIQEANRPGQTVHNNNQLTIYRPVVKQHDEKQQAPAPRNIVAMNQAKPMTQRHTEYQQQHPEYHSNNVNNTQNLQKNNDNRSGNTQQQHIENNQQNHVENNQQNNNVKVQQEQNSQQKQNEVQGGNQQHQVNGNMNQQHQQEQNVNNNQVQQGNQQNNNRGNYNTKTNKQVPVDKNQQKTGTKNTTTVEKKKPVQQEQEKDNNNNKKER